MAHVGLVADGSALPLFVVSRDTHLPTSVDKNNHYVAVMPDRKGEAEDTTLAYLQWVFQHSYLKPGELVLMDAGGGHQTEGVKHWLQSKGILFRLFPPGTGKWLNPCDNSFNADFARKYHLRIAELHEAGSVTHEARLHAMMDAYDSTHSEGIVNMFRHCGILHNRPHQAVKHLMNEGYRLKSEYKHLHQHQLDAYAHWCTDNNISIASALPTVTSMFSDTPLIHTHCVTTTASNE